MEICMEITGNVKGTYRSVTPTVHNVQQHWLSAVTLVLLQLWPADIAILLMSSQLHGCWLVLF